MPELSLHLTDELQEYKTSIYSTTIYSLKLALSHLEIVSYNLIQTECILRKYNKLHINKFYPIIFGIMQQVAIKN